MMQFMRPCPLCGGKKGVFKKEIKLYIPLEYGLPEKYDVVICDSCGFAFADMSLSIKQLERYYEEFNSYENISNVKKEIYQESYKMYFRSINKFFYKTDKILDVGCGNGALLKYLMKKGYNHLWGLDPSSASINILKDNGINGFVGSIYEEMDCFMEGDFDGILCTGVLEHLLDIQTSVCNMSKLLRIGGLLYIVVPNAEGFGNYHRELPNYFNHEHINYFTTNSLDMLMKQAGFQRISEETECRYIINQTSPEMILCAVYQKGHFPDNPPPFVINKDMTGLFSIQCYFDWWEKNEKRIAVKIQTLINMDERPLIIFGTGSYTCFLLGKYPMLLSKTIYFVDNNHKKQGAMLYDKRICSPDILYEKKDAVIVICVMLNSEVIEKQLKEMKITNSWMVLK